MCQYRDRPECVALQSLVDFDTLAIEDISGKNSVKCSVGIWTIRILRAVKIMNAWAVKLQMEAKTLPGHLH